MEAVALDNRDGVYTVSVQVDFQDGGGIASEYIAGSGRTIPEAFENAEKAQDKKLFLGHCKKIIIGNGIENLKDELLTFRNERAVSPRTEILIGSFKTEDAFSEREEYGGFAELIDLYADKTVLVPMGTGGLTIITDGEIKGKLQGGEAKGARILLGRNKKFTEVISKDGISDTVWIEKTAVRFLPKEKDGRRALKILVDLKGRTDGRLSPSDSEAAVSKSIRDCCVKAVSESSSMGADFLNLYERIYMKPPVSDEESEGFADGIPVEIEVRCKLESKKNF